MSPLWWRRKASSLSLRHSVGNPAAGNDWIQDVSIDPAGRIFATVHGAGCHKTVLRDVSTGHEIRTLGPEPHEVLRATFAVDSPMLATGGKDGTVTLWNINDGCQFGRINAKGEVWSMAFSPDHRFIAIGSRDCGVSLFDVASGALVAVLSDRGRVTSLTFSEDNTSLAAGSDDGPGTVWSTESRRQFCSIQGVKGQGAGFWYTPSALAFLPGGTLLAAGTTNGVVQICEAANGRILTTIDEYDGRVFAMSVSAKAGLLAVGYGNGSLRLIDVNSYIQLAVVPVHSGSARNHVVSVAFSANGTLCATAGSGVAKLWALSKKGSTTVPS